MAQDARRPVTRRKWWVTLGAIAALAVVAAGCDPGWVNPSLGTGDGSGTEPGPDGVPAADVAVDVAADTVDLGARGYLTWDAGSCRILVTRDGSTSVFAGTGECGREIVDGPATEVAIDVQTAPFGNGLTVDGDGNVYFAMLDGTVTGGEPVIRRIDPTGSITSVPVVEDPHAFLIGLAPAGDGAVSYLYFHRDPVTGADSYEIREVDAAGVDRSVETLTGHGVAGPPTGFIGIGPAHRVVVGWDGPRQVLIDVDDGVVTATELGGIAGAGPDDLLFLSDVDDNGDLYGVSFADDAGFDGNHVVRVRPDGTVRVIAGSGTPDPGTTRQQGPATDLDLSAGTVSVTRHGNLLVSSGHVVYRLTDAAAAPAPASDP